MPDWRWDTKLAEKSISCPGVGNPGIVSKGIGMEIGVIAI
jgi:hypothetical protein